jgi:uncharacterized hydrophobic protein (TIGR00271 family)
MHDTATALPARDQNGRHILVAVGERAQLSPLLTLACMLTHSGNGTVTLLCVTPDGARPPWLQVPEHCSDLSLTVDVRAGEDAGRVILRAARELTCDLILLGWSGEPGSRRYLLGSTLDPVTRYAPCDIAVVRADQMGEVRRVLIPAEGGPHATRALALALQLSPHVQITALNIAREGLGEVGVAASYEKLYTVLEPWRHETRVQAKVVRAPGIVAGILREAALDYDLLLIGGSDESYIDRQLFGNVPQTVAVEAPVPTIIVRRHAGPVKSLVRQAERWLVGLQGPITAGEQVEAYREVRRGARGGMDFYVLVALAAAIATLGLLMNSPAVIIGAMIIAPLMSAIFGISMGVVQGDERLLVRAIGTTLRGAGLAIAIGALIGWIAPNDQITGEMVSRTNPTLLDLFVALLSGVAGAYAQCRRGVLSAVAGVAIAVALIPPLVATGTLLSSGEITSTVSALLLFFTNLSAITAVGSVVFLFFGFRPDPGKRILVFGRGIAGVLLLLVAVSIPLSLLTLTAFRSTLLHEAIDRVVSEKVGMLEGVELDAWEIISEPGKTLRLAVHAWAVRPVSQREMVDLQERVTRRLDRPLGLLLSITPITSLDPVAPPSMD